MFFKVVFLSSNSSVVKVLQTNFSYIATLPGSFFNLL